MVAKKQFGISSLYKRFFEPICAYGISRGPWRVSFSKRSLILIFLLSGVSLLENVECQAKDPSSQTGYTGEDGFEIMVFDTPLEQPDRAMKDIWNEILSIGSESGVLPCGLGARDSLRLEAGMCLYGQDIDESTTPVEAALDSIVSQDERNFIGKEIISKQLRQGTERKRIAFSMIESGIPRHGYEVTFSGQKVGNVTSG